MAQGAKVCSRICIELDGERCTKFFFQQTKNQKLKIRYAFNK